MTPSSWANTPTTVPGAAVTLVARHAEGLAAVAAGLDTAAGQQHHWVQADFAEWTGLRRGSLSAGLLALLAVATAGCLIGKAGNAQRMMSRR